MLVLNELNGRMATTYQKFFCLVGAVQGKTVETQIEESPLEVLEAAFQQINATLAHWHSGLTERLLTIYYISTSYDNL